MFSITSCFQKACVVTVVILVAASAQADPEGEQPAGQEQLEGTATTTPATPSCTDGRPWYCGVSEVDRARALELYAQANRFFDDTSFPVAIERYQAALAYWNHPGIQYNLMLALVVLENPIEAYQASMEALRYGVKALKLEEYRRALDYQRLLRRQVAYVEVTCDEPAAVVSLDGKDILVGPGTVRIPVLPGQRELVAKKAGYLTTRHSLVAETGKPVRVQMRLLPQNQATIPVRRWPSWKPWAMVGVGAGVGLAGGLLEWRSDIANQSFQKAFIAECPNGCTPADYKGKERLQSLQDRYTWHGRLGRSFSIVGGAAAITGMAMLYMNREQRITNPERQNLIKLSLIPSVTPSGGQVTLNMSF